MPNLNKITKEERNINVMRKQRILLELTNILLQERLINVDEKIRLEKMIQEGNV